MESTGNDDTRKPTETTNTAVENAQAILDFVFGKHATCAVLVAADTEAQPQPRQERIWVMGRETHWMN